jgi:hypothetical protein
VTDRDLDDLLRDGLEEAGAPTRQLDSTAVAAGLEAHRARRSRRRARTRAVLAAAGVVAVASLVSGLVLRADDRDPVQVVAGPTTAAVGSGTWQSVDTGAMPSLAVRFGTNLPSIVWTGVDIVVVGAPDLASDGGDPDHGTGASLPTEPPAQTRPPVGYEAFAYRPTTREWRQLAPMPLRGSSGVTAAWTGTEVVVVSRESLLAPDQVAAAWNPISDTWRDIGNPGSVWTTGVAAPSIPISSPSGGPSVFWTGERLLDATHMAAWDPDAGTWSRMAYPPDVLTRYSHLAAFDAVWDGEELVATAWTTRSGLAWNATGTEYRQLPGMPAELASRPGQPARSDAGASVFAAATVVDGRVLLVSAPGGVAASLDARSGTWRGEPDLPQGRLPADSLARTRVATIEGRALVQPPGTTPFVLADGNWVALEDEPAATGACLCTHAWISGGDFLFSWASGTAHLGGSVAVSIFTPSGS